MSNITETLLRVVRHPFTIEALKNFAMSFVTTLGFVAGLLTLERLHKWSNERAAARLVKEYKTEPSE